MTKDELKSLLKKGESPRLDWKRDFPQGILRGKRSGDWNKGRGKLLKSLISLANTPEPGPTYLIYGVEDSGRRRKVIGISKPFDDAEFQQWALNTFDPPPKFLYTPLDWSKTKTVGIFQIERIPEFPHVVKNNIGGILFAGQVWFRRGSQNNIALHSDLKEMIEGIIPFKISSPNDPAIKKIKKHYKSEGKETTLIRMCDKDSYLDRGYKIATKPGTRKEVWVGPLGDRYELILLSEPEKATSD